MTPVSLTLIALAGGAIWCVGWSLIAVAIKRRAFVLLRPGMAGIAVAGLAAVAGLRQAEILGGREHAVVVSPSRLRAMPSLGGEPGAEILLGEVTRVRGRQGVWMLVQLSDGRRGWLESQRLEVLGVE